jgi:hypothetical protein
MAKVAEPKDVLALADTLQHRSPQNFGGNFGNFDRSVGPLGQWWQGHGPLSHLICFTDTASSPGVPAVVLVLQWTPLQSQDFLPTWGV